ncbi:hypothetical protein RHSIM_Rhsim10G0179000 [Rhododendron simsii]|uniref:RNase H type-1 domain-containing protein n=1 Tax=Rhododendron simsii TaxID=118357 RepID=A0A834GFV1_RHOSS|nr:hypothetical protein RHSIM_Rhsim10G0179000 [Rhododendron simsii]
MNEHASILAWFDSVIDRWKGLEDGANKLTLCTMILWHIWKCLNEKLFNEILIEPNQAILFAVKDATKYVTAMREERGMQRLALEPSDSEANGWQPPGGGRTKVNVDGAWQQIGCKIGAGMVARGVKGDFIAARAANLGHARSAIVVEALEWSASMEFAELFGFEAVIFEGDSQVLVRILNDEKMGKTNKTVTAIKNSKNKRGEKTKIICDKCGLVIDGLELKIEHMQKPIDHYTTFVAWVFGVLTPHVLAVFDHGPPGFLMPTETDLRRVNRETRSMKIFLKGVVRGLAEVGRRNLVKKAVDVAVVVDKGASSGGPNVDRCREVTVGGGGRRGA